LRHGAALARPQVRRNHTHNEKVLQFEPFGDGVRVTTDKGEYRASRLIVTAGSSLPELMPEAAHHFKVQRQVLYWFVAKDEAQHACLFVKKTERLKALRLAKEAGDKERS
jgi:glycine/D-amino acid oxidase-like deaminating enzyme